MMEPGWKAAGNRDTKVALDTLVQLFSLFSSGLIAVGLNTKEPESADEHPLTGIGDVNEQRTNRSEEL
jgi:hypothetical protein